MKLYSKIIQGCSQLAVCGMLILGMSTCYDEKMEWGTDYRHPDFIDLPVELREQIDRYEVLTAYLTRFNQNFKLGAGIDFKLYMNDDAYQKIVNENFKDVTAGNEMKQTALMDSRGNLNFKNADDVIAKLTGAGLGIYGHVLVWHQQQRASFLNSLIAPTVIPAPPGENQLDLSGLKDGTFNGWSRNNAGGITIVEGAGLNNGAAIRFEVTNAGNEWDTQLLSPEIPAVIGHAYEISFWIKSEGDGQGRMSFAGMRNNYPWVNGGAYFNTSGSWVQVTYNEVWDDATSANVPFTSVADAIKIAFDLGKFPGVYYVDLNSISVIDLDAEGTVNYVNLVVNGTFEGLPPGGNSDDLYNAGWNSWGGTSSREVSAEGEGYRGGLAMIIRSSGATVDYGVQATTTLTESFIIGHEYHVEAMIKSSPSNGSVRIQFQGGGEATYLPTDVVGTSWMKIEHNFVAENENNRLFFDLGAIPADYYIDDVVVYDVTATQATRKANVLRAGPIVIEKTPEEKAQIIGDTLKWYITEVVKHFKGTVHAWEVVNEALNDNGTLRSSSGSDGPEEFYWQDYLGKDYAVIAFKAAAAADPAAKLFINDYNLESTNQTKLNKLIEYVGYIESQGARVDGIGTQMHLNINWSDTTGIKRMFEELAKTGKLIKVTELDIAMSSSSGHGEGPDSPINPTLAQYAQQAELYRYVADMYYRIIPTDQQYGITVWGISDNEKEHEYWLKNDAPNLWDAKYVRKHAYKGFADGLAGKDVGAEFKQDTTKWQGR